MKKKLFSCSVLLFLFLSNFSFASDTNKAEMLRDKCEKENTVLNVSVKNFGDNIIKSQFEKSSKLIKIGKLKITQSKFKDAIDKYNEYLKLQSDIYKLLADIYLKRTKELLDASSEDLVDFLDNKKVDQYFKLAYRNLKDATDSNIRKHYTHTIAECRKAKNFALKAYELVNKKFPEIYKVDNEDNNYKIFK